MRYGRDDSEWDELVRVGRRFLEEQARLEMLSSYTEFNTVLARRSALRSFDFECEDERAAVGYLLGLIVEDSYPETEVMLSALVKYLNENDAGPGFFELAHKLGRLPAGASKDDKLVFWSNEVKAVHEYYRRRNHR